MTTSLSRCQWCLNAEIERDYHDNEWGEPLYDDQLLFESLCLEGAQAGLSWLTILRKRENYRLAFDYFNAEKIAQYDDEKIEVLMQNTGIIRHRLKVNAFITNAKIFLEIQDEYASFSTYIWQFSQNKEPFQNQWQAIDNVTVKPLLSQTMSKALKKRGFKFVGPTICYAFMQATGMINDHTTDCFRHKQLNNKRQCNT